ncbi:MAG: DNA polymerase III subunit delta' [Methylobacter sp.]
MLEPLLPWQQQNWNHLCNYRLQKRIPQALLITGHKGLGKLQLAHQFAFSLLCEKPQASGLCCGHCHSCLLLNAGTHPDLIQIMPDEPGKPITIDQIRNLITQLTLKPQFDYHRVVVINPADLMNIKSANAFLKCLEEPTERTIIVLITDKPTYLPATIVSRCQKLSITAPDKQTVLTWLKQQTSQDNAELLLSLAQDAPLLALNYGNNGNITVRNNCFNTWIAIAQQRSHPVVIAENWYKLPESPLIFWITSWIIDLIKCSYQAKPNSLYNPDLFESLQKLSQKLDLKALYKLYDLLLITRQRLDTQINKHIMYEEILIQWAEINRSK